MSSDDNDDTVNVDLSSADEDAILRTPGRDIPCDSEPEQPSSSDVRPATQSDEKPPTKVRKLAADVECLLAQSSIPSTLKKRAKSTPRCTTRIVAPAAAGRAPSPSVGLPSASCAVLPTGKRAKRAKLTKNAASGGQIPVEAIPLPPAGTNFGEHTMNRSMLAMLENALASFSRSQTSDTTRVLQRLVEAVHHAHAQLIGNIRAENSASAHFLQNKLREKTDFIVSKIDQQSGLIMQLIRTQAAQNQGQVAHNNAMRHAIAHTHTMLRSVLESGVSGAILDQLLKDMRDKIIRALRNATRQKVKGQRKEPGENFLPKNFWEGGDENDGGGGQGKSHISN